MKLIKLTLIIFLVYSCENAATDGKDEEIKDSLSSVESTVPSSQIGEVTIDKMAAGAHRHIFLNYTGNQKHIADAVLHANDIFNSEAFYEAVAKSKSFDNTKISPAELASLMRNTKIDIDIETYYYLNPFKPKTCVNANTPSSVLIRINTRCFDEVLSDAVNTLVHESVHAVDLVDDELDFTHWSNDNSDGSQDNTAPWIIGAVAEEMIQKG